MRGIRSAEIIAVGSELLTPHRIDTNSLYLTGRLNDIGVEVTGKIVVGDDRLALSAHLHDALGRADLVITTGGLGPTDDDVTREVAADVMGLPLEEDEALLASLTNRFAKRQMAMPAINRRQAQVPRGSQVLANPLGTAPGLLMEDEHRTLVLLPGPPRELKPMFEAAVMPTLENAASGSIRRRRVVKTTGRPESQVEELIQTLDAGFRAGSVPVDRTILASPGQVAVHLSAAGAARDVDELDRVLSSAVANVASRLGAAVFSVDGRSLNEVVGARLLDRGWRLSAAESCTGGLLLGCLTDVPGSSAWVAGGIVAYANEVKVSQLGVPPELLAAHGAVSEPVARAMAAGVRGRLQADVGVAVTGIAGPDGGSPAKPVGTVAIAVSGPTELARTFTFPGDRGMVRAFSVAAALDMVRRTAS